MPENDWAVIVLAVCVGALVGASVAAGRELYRLFLRKRRTRRLRSHRVWLG